MPLSAVAALAMQLAEAATEAFWNLPADAIDTADELEQLAETARTAAERLS